MRIVLIHSGHGFSTLDVGIGMAAGLRANGCEVFEYPLHQTFETAELLVGAARTMGLAPEGGYPDPIYLGTMGIPGFVMAKRADLTIFIHGLNVPASIPATLHRGGFLTALYCTESPYETDKEANAAQFYDLVFTSERKAVSLFVHNHPDCVHYLPHAYNPDIHRPDGERAPACDVFFCGTRYPERAALLDGIDWTGIDLCDRTLDYATTAPVELLASVVDNRTAAAHYRSAKISLNHHRRVREVRGGGAIAADEAESLGPRPYEIAACGGFLISDARAELNELFAGSVPVYTDSASLGALIRYYLTHEDERAAYATRQHQAVRDHSWTARARQLLDVIHAGARQSVAA